MTRSRLAGLLAASLCSPLSAAELNRAPFMTPAVSEAFQALQASISRSKAVYMSVPGATVAGLDGVVKQGAATETVRAAWKRYYYDGPQRRHYDCWPALQALGAALDMTESRRGSSGCSGSRGLSADWLTLTPLKEGETPDGPVVEATWVRATMQTSLSDPRGCVAYADTLGYLLDRLPVRRVTQSVFCQQGSGYISVSFEYPASLGARPR